MERTVIPYKLVQHLKEICEERKEYEALLSVWQINKESCHKILENIIIHYPHYTLHDLSHSESIITNIEMLLGEQAIRKLSPTDTWLLLQAAYLHDFGMVLAQDDIDKNWVTEEFQEYLNELEASYDKALQEAAKYINRFRDEASGKKDEIIWPLRIRKYVTLIIADYYRGRHASMSREYLGKLANEWGLDLGFNGLIPQRLIFLLGDVSYLHTEDMQSVLNLDYVANGFSGDYIHPRFVAEMLRMGDLLDMDNNRFNPFTDKVIGGRPASSDIHIQKHLSATHIVITPSLIEYRADCKNEEVYRETQHFVTWLKQEVNFLTLNWREIMPEDIEGSAPKLNEPELLLRGEEDIAGVADLRFEISQEKAFETIEGANIYDNDYIFLRELIQNALDACKLQLWNDICAGKYSAWLENVDISNIKPFQIDSKIYENYRVQVVFEDVGDYIEVIVKDNGTGISKETFHRICNVGTSYAGDKKWKKTLKEMPRWLKPTAGFGIGLQSIFLVADKFEIYSRSKGEGIKAIVESRKKNGYVQLYKDDSLKVDGTQIHVMVKKQKNNDYKKRYIGGQESRYDNYIHTEYDPFAKENLSMQFFLMDEIINNCHSSIFPIEIYFEKNMKRTVKPNNWHKYEKIKDRYYYTWLAKTKSRMQIWDIEKDVKFDFSIANIVDNYFYTNSVNIFFKGMKIDNHYFYIKEDIDVKIDFYGLDSKEYLSLDRKKIKDEHFSELNKILTDAIDFFCDQVWEHVIHVKEIKFEIIFPNEDNPKELLYPFWRMVSISRKDELIFKYKELFKQLDIRVRVFKLNESGDYVYTKVHMLEITEQLDKVARIGSSSLQEYKDEEKNIVYYEKMAEEFNRYKNRIKYNIIIADMKFEEVYYGMPCSELIIFNTNKEDDIVITNICKDDENKHIYADDETKNTIYRSMVVKPSSINKSYYLNAVRGFVPAIEQYGKLTIERRKIKSGVGGKYYGVEKLIISPITSYDLDEIEKLSCDEFVEYITEKESYKNLLNYTYENQYDTGKYTVDEIDETYKKLIKDYYESGVWRKL